MLEPFLYHNTGKKSQYEPKGELVCTLAWDASGSLAPAAKGVGHGKGELDFSSEGGV